jgi:hypothetical protein
MKPSKQKRQISSSSGLKVDAKGYESSLKVMQDLLSSLLYFLHFLTLNLKALKFEALS